MASTDSPPVAHAPAFSSGSAPATLKAPRDACDCHHHIFDTRVPSITPAAARPDALVADYRLLQQRIGTTRSVVVTASNYGTNNQATTDAIELLGVDRARGVGVVDTDVSDESLRQLHRQGIRGIRMTPVAREDVIKALSHRIADLGWHIQFNIQPRQVAELENVLSGLPVPIVFDHLARISDVTNPDLDVIRRLLDTGKAWVKLSGVYVTSKVGGPTYADSVQVAKTYIKAAPQRMLWGSDWPHPSAHAPKPDDATLFDLNAEWATDEATLKMILVSNPEHLYGF